MSVRNVERIMLEERSVLLLPEDNMNTGDGNGRIYVKREKIKEYLIKLGFILFLRMLPGIFISYLRGG